ncbi:MAG: hypothetical protein LBT79_04455 [Elusimicrobiota bacterium]|nr:hypothetical protein [Elusimicrobiota bacterium]
MPKFESIKKQKKKYQGRIDAMTAEQELPVLKKNYIEMINSLSRVKNTNLRSILDDAVMQAIGKVPFGVVDRVDAAAALPGVSAPSLNVAIKAKAKILRAYLKAYNEKIVPMLNKEGRVPDEQGKFEIGKGKDINNIDNINNKEIAVSEKEISDFMKSNESAEYIISGSDKSKAINAVKNFIKQTSKYTKQNPLQSSKGDNLHFEPYSAALKRLGKANAYIENGLHFITNRYNRDGFNIREFDKSKFETIDYILEVASNPDKKIPVDSNKFYYWKDLSSYGIKNTAIILKIDAEGEVKDVYRVSGSMPGKSLKGTENRALKDIKNALEANSTTSQPAHWSNQVETNIPNRDNNIQTPKKNVNSM